MSIEAVKSTLGDLIAMPSISSKSNLNIIEYLAQKLEAIGAEVEIQKDVTGQKANLFATIGPKIDGGIVLSGHSDVVPVEGQDWTHDPFEMIEKDDKLYGRGSCDMKGFIACAVVAAENYAKLELRRPVHFAFTYDEEVGCFGAKALAEFLEQNTFKPSVAIIGEPTNMRCIEGHKGICEYHSEFHGQAGHGSLPDLGVNAVEYAVRYVSKLFEIREALKARVPNNSRFDPPWSTLNVGVLKGGNAPNVIAQKAELAWEFRPVQKDDIEFVESEIDQYVQEELLPNMQAVFKGSKITTQTVGAVIGLEPMDENEAKEIVMALTGDNQAGTVSFATEAGIFQSIGMSAVVCGPGSIEQAHKADEYIEISELESCLFMLEALGETILR